MSKVVNDCLDENLYNIFWNKLQQTKFDIFYYDEHFRRCTKITRYIKYFIVGATAIATGIWTGFGDVGIVPEICACVIIFLQAISAVSDLFPHEKRKTELREISIELEKLYIDMEMDWRKTQRLEISNDEIEEKIQGYALEQLNISQHYFKDDALPEKERIRLKVDVKTEEYFNNFI